MSRRVISLSVCCAAALISGSLLGACFLSGAGGSSLEMRSTGGGTASPHRHRAAHRPPISEAGADAYSVAQDTELTIAAPGVLVNDTPNGGSITGYGPATGLEQTRIGEAVETTMGGSVTLHPDGSFDYSPASGFSGSDTFVYQLQNAGGSASATVTITVEEAPLQTTFTVTSPGFFYLISGFEGQNPVVTLKRGVTYTFNINTSTIHPFEILGAPSGSLSNNNISQGTIVFQVPLDATNYDYQCSIHFFGNTIVTVP